MVPRLISLGLLLGLGALAALEFWPSPAGDPDRAGDGATPNPAAQRPAPHGAAALTAARVGPQAGLSTRAAEAQRRNVRSKSLRDAGHERRLIATERAGARKAVPVTRGQELGLRFRPDERASPYGGVAPAPPGTLQPGVADEIQAQFRPTRKRRKPTYEELNPDAAAVPPPMAPVLPYPMMGAPPLPGYGGYPPGW